MLDSYPGVVSVDAGTQTSTIDALNDCFQACTADVDADLREPPGSQAARPSPTAA